MALGQKGPRVLPRGPSQLLLGALGRIGRGILGHRFGLRCGALLATVGHRHHRGTQDAIRHAVALLVHMAVVQQLANNRQGTQKAKTRSEVSGGGRKPWRQKGTGHARQGSIRAPQWTGGGVVFAPVPRDYSFKLNKKEKRAALKSALTDKVANAKLIVVDELKFEEIKTKNFAQVMKNLDVNNGLVVVNENDVNVMMSAKNIADVKMALPNTINVYDIMKAGKVVLTKDAVKTIEEVYA